MSADMTLATPAPDLQPAGAFLGTDGSARLDRRAAALASLRPETAKEAPEAESEATPAPQRERPAILSPSPDDGPPAEDRVSVAVRAREKAARIRREAETERAAVARDRAQVDLDRREVAQLRAARETLAKDPLAGLKELGFDMRDLAERAAVEGTPDAQIRELERRLQAQETAQAEWQKNQNDNAFNGARTKAEGEFFALAMDEERFPHLAAAADISKEKVSRDAYRLQEDYHKHTGKVPSITEIAEALDYLAAEEYRGLTERHARRGANASRADGPAPATAKAKPSRTTLSASKSGEKSAVATTTAGMSRDERKAYALGMLTSGRL